MRSSDTCSRKMKKRARTDVFKITNFISTPLHAHFIAYYKDRNRKRIALINEWQRCLWKDCNAFELNLQHILLIKLI